MKGLWKLVILVLIVIVLITVGVGCYFVFRPKEIGEPLKFEEHPYSLESVLPGLFKYPNGNPISITANDPSNGIISLNDRKLYVEIINNFDPLNKSALFVFLITSFKQTKTGKVTSTVQIIIDGNLLRCNMTTDSERIIIKTNIKETVKLGVEGQRTDQTIESNTIIMSFWRENPDYPGGDSL